MKEITITPSDESIKEQWELHQKLKFPKELDGDFGLTYDEFYKKHKKPLKALLG